MSTTLKKFSNRTCDWNIDLTLCSTGITSAGAPNGLINISIASSITKFLQGGRHVYDIVLTRPSGFKFVAVEGNALVRSGINTFVHYFGSP